MNFAFTLTLLVSLLIAEVYCNHEREHENNHHNNHGDNKWITFVSQIESFWKTETPVKSSETITESSFDNKEVHSFDTTDDFGFHRPDDTFVITDDAYHSEKTTEADDHKITSEITLLNGTTLEEVSEGVKMSLAAIISIPIVGVIVLICCCYCICKCCCSMCTDTEEGHVVVMNSNVVQPPPVAQPTHVIVQQPIYQQVSPPQQVVHQYPPPPQQQQYGQPLFQQQVPPPQYYEYPKGGIENPNFYHASAPPHSTEKY